MGPVCRRDESRDRADGGFTLVELIVVCAILPIIVLAITLSLIEVLSLSNGVSSRISDAEDAQIVSSHFDQDVQSAEQLTTSATVPTCGPSGAGIVQLLALRWAQSQTVVSYVEVAQGTGTASVLVRQYCAAGSNPTPTSSSTVSGDIGNPKATVTPPSDYSTWTSTQSVTGVQLDVLEPGSQYPYTLLALPADSASNSQVSSLAPASTSCGFATPGSGTYASTLCFVDFSSYDPSQAAVPPLPLPGCQEMSAAVAGTPFTLTFCLNLSGVAVTGAATPTYYAGTTSEAFLGNNGFYTGIPGDAALYQPGSGTTTATITDIKLLDANGQAATGWVLVSGDAESTDMNEYITWTTTGVTPPNLNLLPNSPTSPYGNACATSIYPVVNLSGLGTSSVTCTGTVDSDKTGTVMLEAAAPTGLQVVMHGDGRQAFFLGLLLP